MKDSLTIKTNLYDLKTGMSIKSNDNTLQKAKISVLEWVYNNGDVRNELECINKLNNYREELTAFEFFGDTSNIGYKVAECKYKVLEEVINS